MKKFLFLLLPTLLLFSCSQDSEILESESTSSLIEASNAMESQRQTLLNSDTYIGIYKGVFTTNNSEYRATAEIIIPGNANITPNTIDRPTATLTLVNGDIYNATAQPQTSDDALSQKFVFSSSDLSFSFSVNQDGTNTQITNVVFKQQNAAMMVIKHSNRAPITPVTGTYVCTECQGHPLLNNNSTQTWNVVIDENTGDIASQVALGSMVFNGVGSRTNCSPDGNLTYCDVGGDFTAVGDTVTWDGSLQFSNLPSNPATDCSEMNGNWTYETAQYGTITGTFVSDTECNLPQTVTLLNADFQSFTGAGFAPGALPSTGRLNSNMYRASGLSDGAMNYGDTKTTGDFARGSSTGNVSTGGIYAFQTGNGNVAWGVQPGGSDYTPGFFAIKIPNNSGNTLSSINVSYDIYVNNNEARGNSANFSYSIDGTTFTPVSALNYTSPAAPDALGWVQIPRSTTISASVADGGFIYIRFLGDDVSGSGSRDEFALDNLVVEGQ